MIVARHEVPGIIKENNPVPAGQSNGSRHRLNANIPLNRKTSAVPPGRGSLHQYPGTSYLATIGQSLRDDSYSPIEGSCFKLATQGGATFSLPSCRSFYPAFSLWLPWSQASLRRLVDRQIRDRPSKRNHFVSARVSQSGNNRPDDLRCEGPIQQTIFGPRPSAAEMRKPRDGHEDRLFCQG